MGKKTAGVYDLVEEVLLSLPKPYGEDIIEDVFVYIQGNTLWHERYDELSKDLREWVVNNWIGKYTKHITGYTTGKQVEAKQTKLTQSYSKLIP